MDQRWRSYQNVTQDPRSRRWGRVLSVTVFVLSLLLLGDPLVPHPSQGGQTSPGEQGLPFVIEKGHLHFQEDFSPAFNRMEDGKFVDEIGGDTRVVYTIDPTLQTEIEDLFARYRVPYGMFVAMEPSTGRVLAMVEYSRDASTSKHLVLRATYPAASLFKLVTASAALERGKVTPETVIRYRGGMYEMNPRNWRDNPRRDRNQITLTDALAKSCNVAFAKVALHWLDAGTLRRQADRFGFNRAVDFELPVDVSGARILSGEKSLASTAAGFGDVGLSPLHGAMIASMIANGGVMMAPRMVERVTSGGKEVYTFKEESLGRSLRPETADQLSQMMIQTIRKGTSRHAFSGWDPDILVGGKTGTLEGDNPPGDYNWFVGMAPINGARIAVAALVINRQLWHIKASYVAKEGLKAYFQKSRVTTISRNQASASKTGSRG